MVNLKKVIVVFIFSCISIDVKLAALASPTSPEYIPEVARTGRLPFDQIDALYFYDTRYADYFKGLKYIVGLGVEPQREIGFELIMKAAKKGLLVAQRALATYYFDGIGTQKNKREAFNWYKKISDQDAFALAQLYRLPFFENEHVYLEVPEWKEYIESQPIKEKLMKLAREKNPDAEFALAELYLYGDIFPKDEKMGIKLLKSAAENHIYAAGQLGKYYHFGILVPQNDQLAFKNFEKAQAVSEEARYHLAMMHLKPGKPFSDPKKAIASLKELAKTNYPDANFRLGELAYLGIDDNGESTEPDYEKAFSFLDKARQLGNKIAPYYLAQMYAQGLGCTKNKDEARALYRQIMDSPDDELRQVKAIMYHYGVFVDKDLEKAKSLYQQVPSEISEKALQEIYDEQYPAQVTTTKSKGKGKTKAALEPAQKPSVSETQASSSTKVFSEVSSEVSKDIDIAGHVLKDSLNRVLSYDDKSIITDIDSDKGIITINDPSEESIITVNVPLKTITGRDLEKLIAFTYDDHESSKGRLTVKKWFTTPMQELVKKYPQETETIDRHRFAQRLDEIMQLYGEKTYIPQGDRVLKNLRLPGTITKKDGQQLTGFFEFGFYKDPKKGNVLNHRFFSPYTKATKEYPKI